MARGSASFGSGWAALLLAAAGTPVLAAPAIDLRLDKAAEPGGVRLAWTGGSPPFEIGRSETPQDAGSAAHVASVVQAGPWVDAQATEPLLFYRVARQCGNGRLDPGEQCDDGNEITGDGCSATCTGIASDDFSPEPNPGWSFVDPTATGAFEVTGAGTADSRLVLHVPGGRTHDAWIVNEALRFLQPSPDSNFSIETKLDGAVLAGTQMQGLYVEGAAGRWLRFDVVSTGAQWKLFAATLNDGVPAIRINAFMGVPPSPVPLHLRLRREGHGWTAAWSTDPVAQGWTTAGSFNFSMAVQAVGLFAGNAGPDPPPFEARFDYFFSSASPVVPEDPITCGDGVLDPWEECDDGNTVHGDGCQGHCRLPFCGDGLLDPGEACDDGNSVSGDGCSSACVGLASDDFSTGPRAMWTFVNPRGDASLAYSGAGTPDARVTLNVPAGSTHDAWTVNQSVRLMQAADDADLELETRLEAALSQATQMQGIFVEESPSRWIRFDATTSGTQWRVFAATRDGGTPVQRVNVSVGPLPSPVPLHLRVKRVADQWTLSHSLDGSAWTATPPFVFAMTVNAAGLFAGNAGPAPALAARFDYFFETSRPIVPEDRVTCGDGVVDPWEQCDDGNTTDGDGCQGNCRNPRCGDGILDPGEQCDDGNNVGGDRCSASCRIEPFCGDGNVDLGEQCDQGPANSDEPDAACRTDCRWARCGDGIVDGDEECDDGNTIGGDGCQGDCRDPACGDGILDAGEGCDDGNPLSYDGCRADCTPERCGDSIVDPGEECDDGNPAGGDGCSASCTVESPLCGNGIRDGGEDCDDGNTVSGDGCSASCRGLVSDDFDPGLDPGWTFLDPRGDASFSLSGAGTPDARLTIDVPGGTRHDPYRYNGAPRMMQFVDDSDFTIEVKFESALSQSAQQQGVLVEQDGGTWIRFDAFSDGSSWHAFAATMSNHQPVNRVNVEVALTASPVPLYLRVVREGDLWTLQYATDPPGGWTTAGQPFVFPLAVRTAGVFAGNALGAPPLTARFDYFFDAAAPIDPEDSP